MVACSLSSLLASDLEVWLPLTLLLLLLLQLPLLLLWRLLLWRLLLWRLLCACGARARGRRKQPQLQGGGSPARGEDKRYRRSAKLS